jgi:hypothetical protein
MIEGILSNILKKARAKRFHESTIFNFQSKALYSNAESMTSSIWRSEYPTSTAALLGQTVAHDPHP